MAGTMARRNRVFVHGTARITACALLRRRQRNCAGTGSDRNGIPATCRWVVHHSVARRANAPRGIWAIKATSLVGIVFRASRCCWFAAAVGLVFSRKQGASRCRFHLQSAASTVRHRGWRCVFSTFRCRTSQAIRLPVSVLSIIRRMRDRQRHCLGA